MDVDLNVLFFDDGFYCCISIQMDVSLQYEK